MNPLRRRSAGSDPNAGLPGAEAEAGAIAVDPIAGKGRPTPKRRDVAPVRGPVKAPRTRKEAYQRQKQLAKQGRPGGSAGTPGKKLSNQEYRAALKRGDATVLPRKDQGPVRKIARDYVDSRRLLSNYLLLMFPLLLVSNFLFAFANVVVLALLLVFVAEWYVIGKRVRALAINRGHDVKQGPMSIGFYAGSRAYMPRRMRMPGPMVQNGDDI